MIEEFKLSKYITVNREDFFVSNLTDKYDIIYTSAAVNDVFDWRLFYFATQTNASYLCVSESISDKYRRLPALKKLPMERQFVKANLDNFRGHSKEKRNISCINLKKAKIDIPSLSSIIIEEGIEILESQILTSVRDKVKRFIDSDRRKDGLFCNREEEDTKEIIITWKKLMTSPNPFPEFFNGLIPDYNGFRRCNLALDHFMEHSHIIIDKLFPIMEDLSPDTDPESSRSQPIN